MSSTFLKLVSRVDRQTNNIQFVDLLIRGLKPSFSTMKKSLHDAGYDDVLQLQSYIGAMDSRQESSDARLLALKENFEKSPWSGSTKDELHNILNEKKKSIRSVVTDPKILYSIDAIAEQAGIDNNVVRNMYESEYKENINDIKLINQGIHTLAKLSEHLGDLTTVLQNQINALRRDSSHPLTELLAKAKNKLLKNISDMETQGFVSAACLETMQKAVVHTKYVLSNYHYVNGGSSINMSGTDKQLVAYLESISEVITMYRTEQVNKYKDTIMADRAQHLLRLHEQINNGIVVDGLPSRERIVDEMHDKLLNRQNIVLTGPAGTGKTELAKYVQRQMIDDMHISELITTAEYHMLHDDLPYLSGNPDATKSELRGKRVAANKNNNQTQMMNELEKEKQNIQLFDYAYSKLELSIKYGIPVIIDEFLRYPESLLAYMKFFRSRKPGEKMTLNNGEQITIRTVNFIATTNEGEQYGLYAKDFINREYKSIKVDYLKDEECSDLIRAKMLHLPGYIPYISQGFFAQGGPVHRLIEVSKDIAALRFNAKEQAFFSGKLNSAGQFTENMKGKLQSAVLDTKRLLECFDFSIHDILSYGPSGALARAICNFIVSSSSYDNDKYLLIHLFSKKGLIGPSHADGQSHIDFLKKSDPQAMHLTDKSGVSIIDKNMAISDGNIQISGNSRIGLTTLPSLTQLSLYGLDITTLPLSSENPRLHEKRQFLNGLKSFFGDNDKIDSSINFLIGLGVVDDTDILRFGDRLLDDHSGHTNSERIEWINQLPDLKPLFDDLASYNEYILRMQNALKSLHQEKSIDVLHNELKELRNEGMKLLPSLSPENQLELGELIKTAQGLLAGNNKQEIIVGIRELKQKLEELTNVSNPDNGIDITTIGGKRKAEALQFLKDESMDTPEYRAMIQAVNFTTDAIEIGGVRRAPDNLKAKDVGMNYTVDTKAKPADYTQAHVFQGEGIFADEDYFTFAAVEKIQKSGKIKLPTDTDMEKTLKALPGFTNRGIWEKGSAKILSILLGTQMSGCRRAGERYDWPEHGYLRSTSPHVSLTHHAWAFRRNSSGGKLDDYSREDAIPCRSLA